MPLETELEHFKSIKLDLLQHHKGKFALIVGTELLGVFDDPQSAYAAGVEQRGNVPMLIKLITEEERTESAPAMMLGLLSARP
jgi:hypothetical protein